MNGRATAEGLLSWKATAERLKRDKRARWSWNGVCDGGNE